MSDPLELELEKIIADCQKWARTNFRWAHTVFTFSIFGSFFATILTSGEIGKELMGDTLYKLVTAILAALPGLMLLLNNTLRFEERTKWFWKKARLAEGYYRQVRDTGEGVSALSKKFSEESEKLEAEWPAFGTSPGQPSKPGS